VAGADSSFNCRRIDSEVVSSSIISMGLREADLFAVAKDTKILQLMIHFGQI
jgi:hypothetical protein